jgi:hypothetical protein
MMTPEQILHWFTYHSPSPEQLPKYQEIREAGAQLALAIAKNSPACADQTAAIRKVREAVMTANAAIACGGQ